MSSLTMTFASFFAELALDHTEQAYFGKLCTVSYRPGLPSVSFATDSAACRFRSGFPGISFLGIEAMSSLMVAICFSFVKPPTFLKLLAHPSSCAIDYNASPLVLSNSPLVLQ